MPRVHVGDPVRRSDKNEGDAAGETPRPCLTEGRGDDKGSSILVVPNSVSVREIQDGPYLGGPRDPGIHLIAGSEWDQTLAGGWKPLDSADNFAPFARRRPAKTACRITLDSGCLQAGGRRFESARLYNRRSCTILRSRTLADSSSTPQGSPLHARSHWRLGPGRPERGSAKGSASGPSKRARVVHD
jgi:hypothetical protein